MAWLENCFRFLFAVGKLPYKDHSRRCVTKTKAMVCSYVRDYSEVDLQKFTPVVVSKGRGCIMTNDIRSVSTF